MREYYVDPASGDDSFDGASASSPWKTLAKLSSCRFSEGDKILLKGGLEHRGTLFFRDAKGSAPHPITLGSYGQGRARILSGEHGGILLRNVSHMAVSGLEVMGAGYPRNHHHGVCLFADNGELDHGHVSVEDMEVSGFGCAGVAIGASCERGFHDVSVRNVRSFGNAYAGFFVWGRREGEYAHRNISFLHCEAASNVGIVGLRNKSGHGIHSGHGILLSCVDGGLVECSKAHGNGELNTAHRCGPAGIWASNSRRITFRGNESFSNRTASSADGGGFGFDGGVTESVMEGNYSHDNDGPGILLARYWGSKPLQGIRIVHNVTENDARRNEYGAVHIWNPSPDPLSDILIRDNTIRISDSDVGYPRGFMLCGRTARLSLDSNRFYGSRAGMFMEAAPGPQDGLELKGNSFEPPDNGIMWMGHFFENSSQWLDACFPRSDTAAQAGQ